jgi:hypothetical protein
MAVFEVDDAQESVLSIIAVTAVAAYVTWAVEAVIKLALPSQNNPDRHKKGTCDKR